MVSENLVRTKSVVDSDCRSNACPEVWDALVSQPGVGVLVINREDEVEFANAEATRLWAPAGGRCEDITGRVLSDFLPRLVAHTVARHVSEVVETGSIIIERMMWRGSRMQSMYRHLPRSDGGPERAMMMIRRGVWDPGTVLDESQYTIVEPSYADLGVLDSLSPRELEVLAYLGQGLRIKEIAEAMGRSPKTVQNHRESIGHKLRVTDRLALAQIARQAGLEPRDATLARLSQE